MENTGGKMKKLTDLNLSLDIWEIHEEMFKIREGKKACRCLEKIIDEMILDGEDFENDAAGKYSLSEVRRILSDLAQQFHRKWWEDHDRSYLKTLSERQVEE